MVSQVQVVAILMMVNAGLQMLMGLLLTVLGPAMFAMISMEQKGQVQQDEKTLMTVMSIVYVALGLVVLLSGILNLIAGIRSLKFRGRGLALTALFCNILALPSCYCAPTSLGVMIYGLIVFFNGEVTEAFAMGDDGISPNEIRERFRRY